jgi:phospholipase/carboxylesterase
MKQHCYLILIMVCTVCAKENATKQSTIDWANPATLNPMDTTIGNFLDANPAELDRKAQEFYDAKDYLNCARFTLAVLRLNAKNSGAIYNLACCYALLGKGDLAAIFLKKAIKAGYNDYQHVLIDTDFDNARKNTQFAEVIDSMKSLENRKNSSGKKLYFRSEILSKCIVNTPHDFDPAKSYKLLVAMHGWGSNAEEFSRIWKQFDGHNIIMAFAEAPFAFSVDGSVGYSWALWNEGGDEFLVDPAKFSEKYILDVVTELKNRFKIDKTYLIGFSQGGSNCYTFGIRNFKLFDGIIPFGGWLDTSEVAEAEIEKAKSLDVFIGHGNKDERVEFSLAVFSRDYLKKAGYNVTFEEFDGGHAMPKEIVGKAVEWLDKR